jgi:hypothetical protein
VREKLRKGQLEAVDQPKFSLGVLGAFGGERLFEEKSYGSFGSERWAPGLVGLVLA